MSNNIPFFLALQSGYNYVTVALFLGDQCLDTITEHNKQSSKNLIPTIDMVLKRNSKTLLDCAFFAAYQGPAPFTTLRVVIATINGLAFASGTPLVGVDGLITFLHQELDNNYDLTAVLLNAFGQEVYYAIYHTSTQNITTGCESIEQFLLQLEHYSTQRIKLVGNGVTLYKKEILQTLGNTVFIPEAVPELCSIESVGKQAYYQWLHQENTTQQLLPLYLKSSMSIPR